MDKEKKNVSKRGKRLLPQNKGMNRENWERKIKKKKGNIRKTIAKRKEERKRKEGKHVAVRAGRIPVSQGKWLVAEVVETAVEEV